MLPRVSIVTTARRSEAKNATIRPPMFLSLM